MSDMTDENTTTGKRGKGPTMYKPGGGTNVSSSGDLPPETAHPLSRESVGDPSSLSSYRPVRNSRRGGRGGRARNNSGPYSQQKAAALEDSTTRWERGVGLNGGSGGISSDRSAGSKVITSKVIGGSSKVLVANLDDLVNEDDINEIFEELAPLKNIEMKTDNNGKFVGSAVVTFGSKQAAEKAVAEYEGAEVDGRPMYLKLIAGGHTITKINTSQSRPVVTRPNVVQARGSGQTRFNGGGKSSFFGSALGGGRSGGRGGGRGSRVVQRGGGRGARGASGASGRGRSRGGRGGKAAPKKEVSAADLDAEMDSYFTKSAASSGTILNAGQPSMEE